MIFVRLFSEVLAGRVSLHMLQLLAQPRTIMRQVFCMVVELLALTFTQTSPRLVGVLGQTVL
jgi:hypothetical protein